MTLVSSICVVLHRDRGYLVMKSIWFDILCNLARNLWGNIFLVSFLGLFLEPFMS